MINKLSDLLNRGVGAFQIIMKSRLVSIGCFLFTGILHVIDPRGGLRWTAGLLALVVALYALLSLIFLLTDKNEKIGKGKEVAGGLVKGVIEGNKDPVKQGQDLVSKNKTIGERSKRSNSRLDDHLQALAEKQKQEPKAGKAVMCVFYAILLAGAVILYFWSDFTITAVHIIVGALLIADSVIGIASSVTAIQNKIPLKNQRLSIAVYAVTAVIGLAFILFSWSTADITMVICGVVLIVKALVELVIMLRNREVLASVKGTIHEIKQQGKTAESETEPGSGS